MPDALMQRVKTVAAERAISGIGCRCWAITGSGTKKLPAEMPQRSLRKVERIGAIPLTAQSMRNAIVRLFMIALDTNILVHARERVFLHRPDKR